VVTLFVGVPEKSASLLLVQVAAPEFQFNAEVSQTPLAVPDHVSVAAWEEIIPKAERSPAIAAEACRRWLRRFAEENLEGRFIIEGGGI